MPAVSSLSGARPAVGPDAPSEPDLSDETRAAVYQWLAGLFARELTAEGLAAYRGVAGAAMLGALDEHPSLAPLVERLRGLAGEAAADSVRAADLAGAFSRLFLGVGGRRSAPPYESAYSGAEGRLFQEPVARMIATIRDLDLHVAKDFPEPPDHLSVQLSVMAELVRRGDVERQRRFLESRLLPWIGAFRDACAAFGGGGFYATAAESLVGFAREDAALLAAGPRTGDV